MKTFIRAERIGNCHLYLTAVANMIDLFVATWHIHYPKSLGLYLQTMQNLPRQYPWLYIKFVEEGCHFIHCIHPYWAGIWTDLVIQKVLMPALKSQRDVTRRRVMSENVILSGHIQCIDVL